MFRQFVRLTTVQRASCVSLGVASKRCFSSSSANVLPTIGTAGEAAAAAKTAVNENLSAQPQTYYEYLDRIWNTKWIGTVQGDNAAFTESTKELGSFFTENFLLCQSALGVDPGVLILAFGGLTRLFTLLFSFYGERASARMQLALPELKGPQDEFNRIYYNENASALEVQVAASLLKNERRKTFKHYETSNLKCIASFAGAPFIMYGLYHVSALCASPVLDVGSHSFLWCTALALPDPYFVLPLTFCALTLANFELSLSKDIKKGWMKNVVWAARLGCCCVVPVAASFRSGVCLYFVGMSLVGLLQPILLRLPAFRKWLNFPNSKAEVRQAEDPLQASLTVQFPYLSHLLQPETEENEMLFRRASAKPSPRVTAVRTPSVAPTLSRYAPGTNPLMQEVPIRRDSTDLKQKASAKKESGAARKSASSKGLSFASGNWKIQQETFSESDFIPEEGAVDGHRKK